MTVADDGPGVDPAVPLRLGVGLSNVQERLRRHFEGNHEFAMKNSPAGGFEVTASDSVSSIPPRLVPGKWKRSAQWS